MRCALIIDSQSAKADPWAENTGYDAGKKIKGIKRYVIQQAARFLLLIKAGFGSKISSPSFGYGLTGRAKFNHADLSALVFAARTRLDGVIIENLDFADILQRYDSPNTLFYCDPPYIETAEYACKFTLADHVRLRNALHGIKAKAAVSLNDCDAVRGLYAG